MSGSGIRLMATESGTDISRQIWEAKYRYSHGDALLDADISATQRRVADALAGIEPADHALWADKFASALDGYRFLPGGRILAGAGTDRRVTLFNCFVMGDIEDSIEGIFQALYEGALTMHQGGGIGYDFSTLRPAGARAYKTGSVASGPVSFMKIWDAMCATVLSTGARRGAMMATLRCDHPDIVDFVEAKRDGRTLRHFNLSVQVTDELIFAARQNHEWPLVFPALARATGVQADSPDDAVCTGRKGAQVFRRIDARDLWTRIARAAYEYAEPGVLFIDRINRWNNLWYRETLGATNPCGEIPLPPYGACDLGSINLAAFVSDPFSDRSRIDLRSIEELAAVAVRMLDNVVDLSRYPLEAQAEQARGTRRIGLGITGLADALCMLGLHYATPEAREAAARIMRRICHAAYRSSIELAREKGAFPFFDKEKHLQGRFIQSLPEKLQQDIARHGIRNSHLAAIAPAGTISLLARNVSSGIEPIFGLKHQRRLLRPDGSYARHEILDHAYRLWSNLNPREETPPYFVTAREVSPEAHIDMQAALQPFVDNAISKTINVPPEMSLEDFSGLYEYAYDKGVKGCTMFRENPVTDMVLSAGESASAAQRPHCCSIEREAD